MKKPFRRLELIVEYGQQAQAFLQGKTLDHWRGDMQLRYAVAHALAGAVENIKEYARDADRLHELKCRAPHVPWNMIIRFRDKMAHYYEILHQDSVYEIVTKQLPDVLALVLELVGEGEHRQGQGFVAQP